MSVPITSPLRTDHSLCALPQTYLLLFRQCKQSDRAVDFPVAKGRSWSGFKGGMRTWQAPIRLKQATTKNLNVKPCRLCVLVYSSPPKWSSLGCPLNSGSTVLLQVVTSLITRCMRCMPNGWMVGLVRASLRNHKSTRNARARQLELKPCRADLQPGIVCVHKLSPQVKKQGSDAWLQLCIEPISG